MKPRKGRRSKTAPSCRIFWPPKRMQPVGYEYNASFLRLFVILRQITPNKLWKALLKQKPKRKRSSQFRYDVDPLVFLGSAFASRKTELRPSSPEMLMSASPRVVTAATHGPSVLARPMFPNVLEAPMPVSSEEELVRLTQEQQARRLKKRDGLCLGGTSRNLEELSSLPTDLPVLEDEPLRTMAFREVTNIKDLETLKVLEVLEALEDEEEK